MGPIRTLLAAVVLAVAGCTVVPADPPESKRPGPAEDHICAGACDHIFVDGGWKLVGHKHNPGCGHVLVNGRWVKAPEPLPEEPDPKDKK